jgi:hypothetical protein
VANHGSIGDFIGLPMSLRLIRVLREGLW